MIQRKEKIRLKYNLLQNISYMFKNIWRWDKLLATTAVVRIPISLTVSLFAIYIPKVILDSLNTSDTVQQVIFTIVVLLASQCVFELINSYVEAKKSISDSKMMFRYSTALYKKLLTIDYEYIENPDTQLMCSKALEAVSSNTTAAMNMPTTFASLVINILSFVIFGGILSFLHPLIIVLLTITALINLFMLRWLRNYEYKMKDENATINRKLGYIGGMSGDFGYVKDIRLYSMASWLHNFANVLIGQYYTLQNKYEIRSYLTSLVNIVIVFLRDGGAYIYLILKAVEGNITPGDFVLYFNAVGQFAGFVSGILNIWSNIQTANLQFNDYRAFEEVENKSNRGKGVDLPKNDAPSIDIENLSYTYPKSEKAILKNINLRIKRGEKLAVVGLNGAGKTTLIKLICGMYTPTEGKIAVNGHEINEYNRDEYYTMFSAVFQYFRYLPLSIAKNIAPANEELDYDKLNKCIALSGLKEKVDKLPDGIETLLIKSINPNATELSGGEAQKLALARALYKDAPILILDEPTAALDPIAESELYQKYNSLTENKTSVYISHRLASTRFCDRIVLIEDGEIAEMGTHNELLAQNGKYANLFNVQSQYYKQNAEVKI